MGHTVEMKNRMFELITLLPPHMTYSKEETSHKANPPNKQSLMTSPEHPSLAKRQIVNTRIWACSWQKDKPWKFILIASVPLGSPTILGCYGNKGIFWRPLRPQSKMGNKETTFLLLSSYLLKLLSSEVRVTLKGWNESIREVPQLSGQGSSSRNL